MEGTRGEQTREEISQICLPRLSCAWLLSLGLVSLSRVEWGGRLQQAGGWEGTWESRNTDDKQPLEQPPKRTQGPL